MTIRTRLTVLASAPLLAIGLGAFAAAPASALHEDEAADFLDALTASYNDPIETKNDKNPNDFDILTKAVLLTETEETLASLDQFTLFAPSDRAFEVLAYELGLLDDDFSYEANVDEKAVTEALVEELGADAIAEVLLYHTFAEAKLTGGDILEGMTNNKLMMANEQNLGVKVVSREKTFPIILLRDKDGVRYNDFVTPTQIDVVDTENTVVHGIGHVLLPKL